MTIKKPKFWDTNIGLIAICLFPLSLIFLFFIFFKKKIIKAKNLKIPVICVGNIYIGGTGKTPVSVFLSNEITKLGKNPVLLRKYYKNHIDEYELIKKNFKNLILSKNRFDSLIKLEKSEFDTVVLDDGFQDYKVKKDLNIVCFHSNQLIGNGLTLPAGPLRESLTALKDADIIIINGNKVTKFEEKILSINSRLEILYSEYKPINLHEFKNKKLLAVAGIGNPDNFFELLTSNNLIIEKKVVFPDHYRFSRSEIENIVDEAKNMNYQIIMTEKDFHKVKEFNLKEIKYLKVDLEIKSKEKIISKIKRLYD